MNIASLLQRLHGCLELQDGESLLRRSELQATLKPVAWMVVVASAATVADKPSAGVCAEGAAHPGARCAHLFPMHGRLHGGHVSEERREHK